METTFNSIDVATTSKVISLRLSDLYYKNYETDLSVSEKQELDSLQDIRKKKQYDAHDLLAISISVDNLLKSNFDTDDTGLFLESVERLRVKLTRILGF